MCRRPDDLGDPDATLRRLNALVELMRRETADGRRVIDNASFRDRLMRLQGRVMALRYNHLRLLSAKLNNKDASLAAMIVKLQGTELRHELEERADQRAFPLPGLRRPRRRHRTPPDQPDAVRGSRRREADGSLRAVRGRGGEDGDRGRRIDN